MEGGCPKKISRHGGYWFIPGGRIEDTDESVEHALRRELTEEIGIEPTSLSRCALIDGTSLVMPHRPFLIRPFVIDRWRGDIPEFILDQPEHPLKWVPIAEAQHSPARPVRQMIAGISW